MDATEADSPDAVRKFTHISIVQEKQLELLKWWSGRRRAGDRNDDDRKRIHAFLNEVKEAGSVIQLPLERRTAQAILDYWATELISARDPDFLDQPTIELDTYDEAKAPDLSDKSSPYCGLNAFSEADQKTFFGRDDARSKLLQKANSRSIVIVSGPSGSGKSSLVLAGLIPLLRQSGTTYEVLDPITPGRQPLEALRRAINQAEMLDNSQKQRQAILVIDQFEELFTLDPTGDRFKPFFDLVTSFARQNRVIICIRDDYVETLKHSAPPGSWATESDAYFSPPPMTPRELTDAIERPAERVGLRFAPEVTERLVKEVVGEPAALPLLQFTLQELWNNRDHNLITQQVYDKVGSPREALQRVADRTLRELGLVENESVAERIFLKLVTPRSEHEFLRSPRTREFLAENESKPQTVDKALDLFVAAGLLRKQPKEGVKRRDDRFDVAHEALIRNWPWLVDKLKAGWRDKERRFQVQMAATMYVESGRRTDYLLKGAKLEEARQHVRASSEIRELVEASDAQAERERQASAAQAERERQASARLFRRAVAVACVVVVVVAAAIAIPYYREQAREQARLDEAQARIAQIREEIRTAEGFIAAPESTNELRITSLRTLLQKKDLLRFQFDNRRRTDEQFVRFVERTLRGPGADFADFRSTGVQFTGSTFEQVKFSKASLPLASFTQATLNDVVFSEVELSRSRFDDTVLQKTTFAQSQLQQSTFDRAVFCKEVTFLVSNMRDASVRQVRFVEEPKFVGTAWWLAAGWSIDQAKSLARQSANVDYASTDPYIIDLAGYERRLAEAKEPARRANAMNNKAWHQAVHRVDVDSAENISRESLKLLRERMAAKAAQPDGQSATSVAHLAGDISIDELPEYEAAFLDTLAYILMLKAKHAEAVELLREATAKSRSQHAIQFHYALALFAVGEKQAAKSALEESVGKKKYIPSHELYLHMAIIEAPDFRGWLEDMLRQNQEENPNPPRNCPVDPNALPGSQPSRG